MQKLGAQAIGGVGRQGCDTPYGRKFGAVEEVMVIRHSHNLSPGTLEFDTLDDLEAPT